MNILENTVDVILGRHQVSLCLWRLLNTYPTLVVPVLADMMVRGDTKELLLRLFRQDITSKTDLLSAKTDELNFETLLIIENWVANPDRVSRSTPFEDGHKAW